MKLTLTWWPRRGRDHAASKMDPRPELTDAQWFVIESLFPQPAMTCRGGRPRVPPRPCLEGILWILRTGARWKDLPTNFPSPATCWRRLKEWTEAGVFQQAWAKVLRTLDGLGRIDWEQALADGTFARAKKGATLSGKPSAAREPRSWCSRTREAHLGPRASIVPVPLKSP